MDTVYFYMNLTTLSVHLLVLTVQLTMMRSHLPTFPSKIAPQQPSSVLRHTTVPRIASWYGKASRNERFDLMSSVMMGGRKWLNIRNTMIPAMTAPAPTACK